MNDKVKITQLDKVAWEIYTSGKGTLAEAYEQAKMKLAIVDDDMLRKFFGFNKRRKK